MKAVESGKSHPIMEGFSSPSRWGEEPYMFEMNIFGRSSILD
jgi:hypothetical protein